MTPRPYQLAGRDFLAGKQLALLADEMRVGKTPQAILAAAKANARNILVVCPAIGVPHWHREFEKWWPGYRQPHLVVRSYDKAKAEKGDLLNQRWDLVIVDEAHFAKNPLAARTQLVYGKNGLGWAALRMWVLSGTPAPKHAAELWAMLSAFGVTAMDYPAFVAKYCHVNPHNNRISGTKRKMIPEIRALLAPIMLRRLRKDVAPEVPAIDFQFLEVAQDGTADIQLPQLEATDRVRLSWLERNATAQSDDRQAVAMQKVKPLTDHIMFALDNQLLEQCVVFGWHIAPLELLASRLNAKKVSVGVITGKTSQSQRERILRDFRLGTIKVVIGNILSCGTTVDLSAANHGYFLELDWVPGNNKQAAERLISLDKTDKVTMDVLTTSGTIDDSIQKVLLRRSQELAMMY